MGEDLAGMVLGLTIFITGLMYWETPGERY